MVGTRVATHNDTQRIVDFLKKYHEEGSNLADIPFDRLSMSQCIDYYVGTARHVCFIYEKEKQITGVLMASVEPFMFNKKRKWATDLLNIADEGGAWLVKRFIAWAEMMKVDRIIMGVSTGDERTDGLYKAMGMLPTGGMYLLNLNNEADA